MLQVWEHFDQGVSHGLRTKWSPAGRKLSEATIERGRITGTFRRWHDNGQVAEDVEMKDGVTTIPGGRGLRDFGREAV